MVRLYAFPGVQFVVHVQWQNGALTSCRLISKVVSTCVWHRMWHVASLWCVPYIVLVSGLIRFMKPASVWGQLLLQASYCCKASGRLLC